jgi:hypothetical protein
MSGEAGGDPRLARWFASSRKRWHKRQGQTNHLRASRPAAALRANTSDIGAGQRNVNR